MPGASPNQPSRLLTTNSFTRLETSSPNVCQSNLAPLVRMPVVESATLTSLEFGYQSGHFDAFTRWDQTTGHGASTSISLCANRSASAGVKPCGQCISEDRAARSRSTWPGVFACARTGVVKAPSTTPAAEMCPTRVRFNLNMADMDISHH